PVVGQGGHAVTAGRGQGENRQGDRDGHQQGGGGLGPDDALADQHGGRDHGAALAEPAEAEAPAGAETVDHEGSGHLVLRAHWWVPPFPICPLAPWTVLFTPSRTWMAIPAPAAAPAAPPLASLPPAAALALCPPAVPAVWAPCPL